MNEVEKNLWEIKVVQWKKGKGQELIEYVVAGNFESILPHLEPILKDSSNEIVSVNKIVPINTIL